MCTCMSVRLRECVCVYVCVCAFVRLLVCFRENVVAIYYMVTYSEWYYVEVTLPELMANFIGKYLEVRFFKKLWRFQALVILQVTNSKILMLNCSYVGYYSD